MKINSIFGVPAVKRPNSKQSNFKRNPTTDFYFSAETLTTLIKSVLKKLQKNLNTEERKLFGFAFVFRKHGVEVDFGEQKDIFSDGERSRRSKRTRSINGWRRSTKSSHFASVIYPIIQIAIKRSFAQFGRNPVERFFHP